MSVAERRLTSPRGEPLTPPSGSKLEMILNTLMEKSSRGEIFFSGPVIRLEPRPGFSEWVDFFVAPPKGIFDVKGLEEFRADLFPNVKSSNYREAWKVFDGMEFGFVAFDDRLVDLERTTTSTVREYEPGSLTRLGLETDIKTERTDHFNRRIIVRVVPHPILASLLMRIKTDRPYDEDMVGLENGASNKVLKVVQELARKTDRGRGSSHEDYEILREALTEEQIALLIRSLRTLSPMKRELLEKLLS